MRRGRVTFFLVSVFVASAVGYGVSGLVAPITPKASSMSGVLIATHHGLGAFYQDLAFADGRLIAGTSLASPTADFSSTNGADERFQFPCTLAPVDPTTLQLGKESLCPPHPLGARVFIEDVGTPNFHEDGGCGVFGLAAARVGANGQVTIGPRIMTYAGGCSGSNPDIVDGGRYIWLYDCRTGPNLDAGELIRVSASTGAVEARIAMPSICKATVAASDGGFWIGPGGWWGNGGVIYHVGPKASAPSAVMSWNGPINWMLGMGKVGYADLQIGGYAQPSPAELYRFGPGPSEAKLISSHVNPNARSIDAVGAGELYGVNELGSVVALDPETGVTSVLATLGPADSLAAGGGWLSQWQDPPLVSAFGALYTLWNKRLYRFSS